MILHRMINECLEMFGIANNVRDFLKNNMKSWKLEVNMPRGKLVGDIRRVILQGDSLSLLFVLTMVPLTLVLGKTKDGYETAFKLNSLLFGNDTKLFGKSKGQIDSLVQTLHIFSEDINVKFGIRSFGVENMQK